MATGDFGQAFFSNGGDLNVTANALAVGTAFNASGSANAIGFDQFVSASLTALATFINDGTIDVLANADATAEDQYAFAYASAHGGRQDVSGGSFATASVDNNGVVNVVADAHAVNDLVGTGTGTTGAGAFASATAHGFGQTVNSGGEGVAVIVNDGTLDVVALAFASGAEGAGAGAYATGIYQDVGDYFSAPVTGTASVGNAGLLDVGAFAQAVLAATTVTGVDAVITARAFAVGIEQDVIAEDDALAHVLNSGTIEVGARALATAASQSARADAYAAGILQDVFITATQPDAELTNIARAEITNDGGLIRVVALATAFNDLANIVTTSMGATFVAGNPFAFASAQAFGVAQDVDLVDGTSIVGVFNNNVVGAGTAAVAGVLSVEAGALASGVSAQASAFATGVFQDIWEGSAVAALASVQNDGVINVAANATAIVDQATTATSGFASANALGIVQDAGANDEADAIVNNGGILNVAAHAVAQGFVNTYTTQQTYPANPNTQTYTVTGTLPIGNISAQAYADGIQQDAGAGTSATATVVNTGIINVHATAEASIEPSGDEFTTDYSNFAWAVADASGIVQNVYAGYDTTVGDVAVAGFSNATGAQLNVGALAIAEGDTATAGAYALGVRQFVGLFADDVLDAAANVTNAGLIDVGAQATATAWRSGGAFAVASATGIIQAVEGQTAGLAFVDNGGTIDVHANALANGTSSARADARAWASGIVQDAGADGDFDLETADTVGPTGHATAQVDNVGTIDVDAIATAHAESGTASAFASADGIIQDAGGSAFGFLVGAFNTFDASTRAQAIFNNVAQATPASTGVLDVNAHAIATATSGNAVARAIASGVHQDAGATNGDALASVVNDGTINVAAGATATGTFEADAFADALGIRQFALAIQGSGAETEVRADALVDNGGVIDVGASAFASGVQGTASAYADGIYQWASASLTGTATGGAVAVASVNNSGSINVHAVANATMDGGFANASAGASAIWQDAGATATDVVAGPAGAAALAQVVNTASAVINANAAAWASGYDVHAGADAFGIFQDAGAEGSIAAVASAIVQNAGGISVIAVAEGKTTALGQEGSARAGAFATGISQVVEGFVSGNDVEAVVTALASVTNSGVILVSADAFAFGSNAGASAFASGIHQAAEGHAELTGGGTNDAAVAQASALIENAGTLSVLANAVGFGVTTAYVNVGATAIDQNAEADDQALARVINTSLAVINVSAVGVGHGNEVDVDVGAFGIFQEVDAFTSGGLDPVVGAEASAIVVNDGAISVFGSASASGGIATADARGIGISQLADIGFGGLGESSFVLASVDNAGAIEVGLVANAVGGAVANAYAYGTGIRQDVDGSAGNEDSTAQAVVLNSDVIHVTNTAVAEGDTLSLAEAEGAAIRQEVYGAQFLFATVDNGLDNEITVHNSAAAGDAYRATANANATGIEQVADGEDGTSQVVVLSVDNAGIIEVSAIATAGAGETLLDGYASQANANATALGITQGAYSIGATVTVTTAGGTATNPSGAITETVTNSGELNVFASASAHDGNGNFADAFARGVLQFGEGPVESIDIAAVNSGEINVTAIAIADGDGDATADAGATGISQSADGEYGADQDNVTVQQVAVLSVDNSGDIIVLASASAVGTGEVAAGASAAGIRQSFFDIGDDVGDALADYSYADVTAIVNNVGHLDVSAIAIASGGETNAAYAAANGVEIFAEEYSVLNLDVFNSGSSIRVFASASADGGDASAYAAGISVSGAQIQNMATTVNNPVVGIVNTGLIRAEAVASGDYEFASAVGINVFALSEFRGSITNDGGTIIAIASGSSAHAAGIRIAEPTSGYNEGGAAEGAFDGRTDYGDPSTGVGTININNGTVFAGITDDEGETWSRGTAIDVLNTPNPIVINLDNEVDIFGNILMSGNDELQHQRLAVSRRLDQPGHHSACSGRGQSGCRSDSDACQQLHGWPRRPERRRVQSGGRRGCRVRVARPRRFGRAEFGGSDLRGGVRQSGRHCGGPPADGFV